ncbi:MAG: dihydrodipicolinate reductase [Deltaproteobacteria bacterium]|nr:dihydrodipicolinate reductase [Deltaproteobacteria bacterium]
MAHRVIVWGTGNVGKPALRTVVSNPALELAGVIVSNPAKVGRDAGELCGLGRLGVTATNDVAAALASGADAVAYCASGDFRPNEALDDVERVLRAGLSVVSTSIYPLYDPTSAPPEIRERMEAACRAGRSSCFVSGIDPGFINDIVPVVLSGLCEEIREIRAYELFNYAYYDQPDAVRNLVGFGGPMDQVPLMVLPGVPTSVWGGPIRLIARGLGVELEEIREVVERRPLERTVTNRMGTFEAGTQGALRFEVQGIVGGEPRIVIEHVTRIDDDTAPDWPKPEEGSGAHGVKLIGRPNVHVRIESEDESGDRAGGGNATAAARIVNAIPFVCAAEPGLLDALSVPLQVGRGLLR